MSFFTSVFKDLLSPRQASQASQSAQRVADDVKIDESKSESPMPFAATAASAAPSISFGSLIEPGMTPEPLSLDDPSPIHSKSAVQDPSPKSSSEPAPVAAAPMDVKVQVARPDFLGLYREARLNISCALDGLHSHKMYARKIVFLNAFIFTGCAVTTYLGLAGKVGTIALGIGVVGMIASAVAMYVYRKRIFFIKIWENAINFHDDKSHVSHLDEAIKLLAKDWNKKESKAVLDKSAVKAFSSLVISDLTYKSDASAMNELFRSVLILRDAARLKVADKGGLYQDTCRYLEKQSSLTVNEKHYLRLNEKSLEDIKKDEQLQNDFKNFGVGSTLLIYLSDKILLDISFDEQGNLKNPENAVKLPVFKTSLKRVKMWLGKEKKYVGDLKTLIEAALKTKTHKEMRDLFESKRELLTGL